MNDEEINPDEDLRDLVKILKKKEKKKKRKGEGLGTSRGIETLFRNTYRVHVELSGLADSKANFLISVNSIIMMVVVSHGMSHVTHKALFVPVALILTTCIVSMVCAVLCARPRLAKNSKLSNAHANKGGLNILFFGNFTQLPKEEFIESMKDVITDPERLYPTMMGDLYEMGKVLNLKFRRLQVAYGVLLYGLPIGVVIFVIMQGIIVSRRLEQ